MNINSVLDLLKELALQKNEQCYSRHSMESWELYGLVRTSCSSNSWIVVNERELRDVVALLPSSSLLSLYLAPPQSQSRDFLQI